MFNFIFRPPSKIHWNIFLGKFYHFDYSVAKTSDFWLGAQFSYDQRNDSPLIVFFLNRRFNINNLIRFYTNACLRFYNSFHTLFYRLTISNQIMAEIKKSIRIFFSVRRCFVSGDTLSSQRNIFSVPPQNYFKCNMSATFYLVLRGLAKIGFFIFPNIFETHKSLRTKPILFMATKPYPQATGNHMGIPPKSGFVNDWYPLICVPMTSTIVPIKMPYAKIVNSVLSLWK